MNNKIEIAFSNHIRRLEADIEAIQKRIKDKGFSPDGMEAQCVRDDSKKIAMLREGLVPRYSDLPTHGGFENNMPEIEMMEFADIMDETAAATHDLDLIDYGKTQGGR